ncbi:hypothetical protein TNCV_2259271 [Trichonephila clavipes]|nr:hypothetical protein TNCV_2259271 [Trichonephila clavipes]
MLCRRIRAHFNQLSEFERSRIIGLKEAGWENRKITRDLGRSNATIRGDEAGKTGWTVADLSVMMVAVDLGPQSFGGYI